VGNQGSHKASPREAEKTPLLSDVRLHYGDCLEVMNSLPEHSINLILCDLPYGLTQNKWDSEIPLEPLWASYKRLLADKGVIALTASQPFTSALVMSNLPMFKHEWVWIKNRGSNFANTVREPMKEHESVLVFAGKRWTYNKQMQERTGGGKALIGKRVGTGKTQREGVGTFAAFSPIESLPELRVPSSWQKFNCEVGLHPTQKPVSLFRYLVRTYSNPGDVVLDNCMGSGTTGVAAIEEGREFIGIENDERYFSTACERLS
jgi:site-specific DNA-methyltransferase (adenine-specific)